MINIVMRAWFPLGIRVSEGGTAVIKSLSHWSFGIGTVAEQSLNYS